MIEPALPSTAARRVMSTVSPWRSCVTFIAPYTDDNYSFTYLSMNTSLMSFARSHRRLVSLTAAAITLCVGAMAAAAIVSGTSTTNSSTQVTITELTLNKPTVSTGDLMLASIAVNGGSSAVITAPSGWTQIARTDNDTNESLVSYWKVAGGSEPSNYTWSINNQTQAEGGITPYSGVDTSNPIDAVAGNTGFGTVATTSAITTSADNEEVVALFGADVGKSSNAGAYFTTVSGMTEKYDVSNTPFGPSTAADDAIQTTAGTASSKSSTISGGKARNWAAQQIALRQPSPGIAFDNSVATALISESSQTTSFTTSGSNICVVAQVNSDHNDVSATYDGVAMTELAHLGALPGTGDSTVFVLAGATSGTHDIVVTASGGVEFLGTVAASYNNCGATQPDSFTTSTVGSAMSFSQSVTSSADNSWGVLLMQSNSNGSTAGTGTTLRASNTNAQYLTDTNGPIHPAGSATLNLSNPSSTNWLGVMVTLAPGAIRESW